MNRRILIVAAHPDDELLGVAGSARKYILNGDEVYVLILGEGQTSRWSSREKATISAVEELHKDTLEAADIVGFKKVFFANLPDNRFDSVDMLDVVKTIEKYIDELRPEVVFTHHGGDLNVDHRVTHQAVLTATRPIGDYSVREIYAFETVSSTEWSFGDKNNAFYPQKYIDITETFDTKCKAMVKYQTELCQFPHPRSIKMLDALSIYRGSVVGFNRAEAFEVIRITEV